MKKNTGSVISYLLLLAFTTATAGRLIPRVPSATASSGAAQPSSFNSLCATPILADAAAASSAAADRGVPYFLYESLNEGYIPADGPSMGRWFDYFWTSHDDPTTNGNQGAILEDCSTISGGGGRCLSSVQCSNIMELYWNQVTITNFVTHMTVFNAAFEAATTNITLLVNQISTDFPIQVPQVSSAAFFNNFGAALSILGSAASLFPDTALIGGAAGVMGGIFSDVGANIPPASLAADLTAYLDTTLQTVYSKVSKNAGALLTAVIVDGDLSAYPASIYPSALYSSQPIAAFFDNGNFLTVPSGWTTQALQPIISQQLLQTIVGAALVQANYYIMEGSYTINDCPTGSNHTGIVFNNICYTLEEAGTGISGHIGKTQTMYSQQMGTATVFTLTNAYKVSLGDIYSSSVACQDASNDYNAPLNFYASGFDPSITPACLYNLPVLRGIPVSRNSEPAFASPCNEFFANSSSKATEVGTTYLPTNLGNIFNERFCVTDGLTIHTGK